MYTGRKCICCFDESTVQFVILSAEKLQSIVAINPSAVSPVRKKKKSQVFVLNSVPVNDKQTH